MNSEQWARVNRLFATALETNSLSQETQSLDYVDPEVKKEVERLLRLHEQASSKRPSDLKGKRPPAFATGQLVACRYFITHWLGRGGMGEVYHPQKSLPAFIETLAAQSKVMCVSLRTIAGLGLGTTYWYNHALRVPGGE